MNAGRLVRHVPTGSLLNVPVSFMSPFTSRLALLAAASLWAGAAARSRSSTARPSYANRRYQ